MDGNRRTDLTKKPQATLSHNFGNNLIEANTHLKGISTPPRMSQGLESPTFVSRTMQARWSERKSGFGRRTLFKSIGHLSSSLKHEEGDTTSSQEGSQGGTLWEKIRTGHNHFCNIGGGCRCVLEDVWCHQKHQKRTRTDSGKSADREVLPVFVLVQPPTRRHPLVGIFKGIQ